MRKQLIAAFLAIPGAPSPDAVIASPELNAQFIDYCRKHGVIESEEALNRSLLNARKSGDLKEIRKSKKTHFQNQDEYRFASEIAIRYLERRDGSTLDQILCDPAKALEFDAVARAIVPGYSSFEYRWAALGLRKRKRLRPELLARVVPPTTVLQHSVAGLNTAQVTSQQGLYIFYNSKVVLYVGESQNVRRRIEKHLNHSDNKEFAQWLWGQGLADMHLEIHEIPQETEIKVRKALELELIISRNPLFNVSGKR